MIVLLTASGIGLAAVLGLAFILPCPACQARRERMRAAYDRWRSSRSADVNPKTNPDRN